MMQGDLCLLAHANHLPFFCIIRLLVTLCEVIATLKSRTGDERAHPEL